MRKRPLAKHIRTWRRGVPGEGGRLGKGGGNPGSPGTNPGSPLNRGYIVTARRERDRVFGRRRRTGPPVGPREGVRAAQRFVQPLRQPAGSRANPGDGQAADERKTGTGGQEPTLKPGLGNKTPFGHSRTGRGAGTRRGRGGPACVMSIACPTAGRVNESGAGSLPPRLGGLRCPAAQQPAFHSLRKQITSRVSMTPLPSQSLAASWAFQALRNAITSRVSTTPSPLKSATQEAAVS